jgi:hypothetical protein
MTNSTLPTGLRIGSLLTLIAGLFVFSVATYFFVMYLVGQANPSAPWPAGGFFCKSPYSLDDVATCSAQWPINPPATCTSTLAQDFILAQHIEFANVMNTGAVVAVITIFGLRRRQRWAWYTLLAIFLWVGLNDAKAVTEGGQKAVPLIPIFIGLTGLALSWKSIFRGNGGSTG